MPELTAVIVNYNAGAELRQALQSLAHDAPPSSWEAVVVDNASSDGSAEIALEFQPHATLIRNAENVGFGRAVNQGLAAARAPLVLIMNPDCRLEPGAVVRLAAELMRHPACAIVGPRILDPDGAEQGSARGDPDMLTGLFGRSATLRRLLPGLGVSSRNVVPSSAVPAGGSLRVDWLSGACMLARADALRAVRGFDERYFLYWEDADLCRRLRAAGREVRYVPSATAVHRVGHSSSTVRVPALKAFHASAYLYYATHVAPGAANPKRLVARALLAFRCWWLVSRA
jgi:N-acetylglucosaminyl-diphospho-decaprenol L-rhamnosyltransferase